MAADVQVDYELVIYDELPSPAARGRPESILDRQLRVIVANREAWEKPVRIALYSQGGSASSAKQVLQKRIGTTTGWTFYTRPVPAHTGPDAPTWKGLFAVYNPEKAVDNGG